jgi:uncharacterized membrane protein
MPIASFDQAQARSRSKICASVGKAPPRRLPPAPGPRGQLPSTSRLSRPCCRGTKAPPAGRHGFTISRPLAKTVTFRTIATTMDFTTLYMVAGDLVTAAGLSAFGFAVGPFVYLGYEMAWDYYTSPKARRLDPPAPAKPRAIARLAPPDLVQPCPLVRLRAASDRKLSDTQFSWQSWRGSFLNRLLGRPGLSSWGCQADEERRGRRDLEKDRRRHVGVHACEAAVFVTPRQRARAVARCGVQCHRAAH